MWCLTYQTCQSFIHPLMNLLFPRTLVNMKIQKQATHLKLSSDKFEMLLMLVIFCPLLISWLNVFVHTTSKSHSTPAKVRKWVTLPDAFQKLITSNLSYDCFSNGGWSSSPITRMTPLPLLLLGFSTKAWSLCMPLRWEPAEKGWKQSITTSRPSPQKFSPVRFVIHSTWTPCRQNSFQKIGLTHHLTLY